MSCPTLLSAIFALSSRHMSFSSDFDEYASDRYHRECLEELSNISNDSSALLNDDLLAATILLRTLEELDVPLLGTDHEGHLLGIQIFMNATDPSTEASPLRKASFWVGLRQEVTMAFASQRSIKIALNYNFIDQSLTPADDDTWANRIILHVSRVVKFCFGSEPKGHAEYQELLSYDESWLKTRPPSWLPVAYSPPRHAKGEVFPQIMYLNHAVGG